MPAPQESALAVANRPGPLETRLHGRWLVVARLSVLVAALVTLALNVIALPDTYGALFTLTQPQLVELRRLGLSPTLYVILLIVENTSVPLVDMGLALLLMWRRSDDRIALLCAFALVTFGGGVSLFDFARGAIAPSLATNPALRILTLTLFAVGEASLVLFFYLFPSGRFVPRWTCWGALVVGAFYLAVIFSPSLVSKDGGPTAFLVPFFLLSAAVAQVSRYRSASTPREREQTKWVVFGVAIAGLFLAVMIPVTVLVLPASVQNDPVLESLNPIFQVALVLIPIFIAIAILRSRLWDIDTIIHKTLVYGSLTALLAAVYAGLISGLESLAGLVVGQAASNPLALVISTLAIAALFQPARRGIQNVIDRRFYRRKYTAEKTLAAFSALLRNEVELEQVRVHLLTVVSETMAPAHVSLWLRVPEQHSAEAEQAYRLERLNSQ